MSDQSRLNPSSLSAFSRRNLLRWGAGLGAGAAFVPAFAACSDNSNGGGEDGGRNGQKVTLSVVGFEVSPEEKGTPLDKAYKKFLADFHSAHPNITIDSKATPPEFDTKIIVDLAAGTAPDLWSQDASSLAPIVSRKLLLDMRELMKVQPSLTTDRFFPSVLEINKQQDGALYGLPNDFTPVVVYVNRDLFGKAKVDLPAEGWTWDDQLALAQELTRDDKGRPPTDPGFDASKVKQWGYRASKYAYLWVYRVWQNGSDVLSPDYTTASGYLDSPATMDALQWYADLVRKHNVSPQPSVLDNMEQKSSFDAQFLAGSFAMFDSGHWELVGLSATEGFSEDAMTVVQQPKRQNAATVIYQSSFAVRYDLPEEKKAAIATFVDAATAPGYQQTKAVTGIALSANQKVAEESSANGQFPDFDPVFISAATNARPPSGSKVPKYPTVENMLNDMMERIMKSGDVEGEVGKAVKAINRELGT